MALRSTVKFAREAKEYIREDCSAKLSPLLQTVESSGLLSKKFNHINNEGNWPSIGVSQLSLFSSVGCLGKNCIVVRYKCHLHLLHGVMCNECHRVMYLS